jgi:hypothetical protein
VKEWEIIADKLKLGITAKPVHFGQIPVFLNPDFSESIPVMTPIKVQNG